MERRREEGSGEMMMIPHDIGQVPEPILISPSCWRKMEANDRFPCTMSFSCR